MRDRNDIGGSTKKMNMRGEYQVFMGEEACVGRRVNSVVDPGVLYLGDCLRFSKTGATRWSRRVFLGEVNFSRVFLVVFIGVLTHFFSERGWS